MALPNGWVMFQTSGDIQIDFQNHTNITFVNNTYYYVNFKFPNDDTTVTIYTGNGASIASGSYFIINESLKILVLMNKKLPDNLSNGLIAITGCTKEGVILSSTAQYLNVPYGRQLNTESDNLTLIPVYSMGHDYWNNTGFMKNIYANYMRKFTMGEIIVSENNDRYLCLGGWLFYKIPNS